MLTYLLNNQPSVFTQNYLKNTKSTVLVLPYRHFYFLAVHLKLSTVWYATQLVELFSYEVPSSQSVNSLVGAEGVWANSSNSILSYNFHNLFSQERLFVFTWKSSPTSKLKSIANLFSNSNWLEREASEMSGVAFEGKQDLRNLLLTYGDSSSPLQKSVPSVGFKEVFFDVNNDLLVQTPITLQI